MPIQQRIEEEAEKLLKNLREYEENPDKKILMEKSERHIKDERKKRKNLFTKEKEKEDIERKKMQVQERLEKVVVKKYIHHLELESHLWPDQHHPS